LADNRLARYQRVALAHEQSISSSIASPGIKAATVTLYMELVAVIITFRVD